MSRRGERVEGNVETPAGSDRGVRRSRIVFAGASLLPVLFLAAAGCSSGRGLEIPGPPSHALPGEPSHGDRLQPLVEVSPSAPFPSTAHRAPDGDGGVIFAHPGLLMSAIAWGGNRARDAGTLLVKDGFAAAMVEVRPRDVDIVYRHIAGDGARGYVGLHYSMGGSPRVVAGSLEAARRAAAERGEKLTYGLILVDPFGFRRLHESIDLDDGTLGQVFVFFSSEDSFLRPDVSAPGSVLGHPKVHVIYAEDFGLRWNHFGALGALRDSGGFSARDRQRTRELFRLAAGAIVGNIPGGEAEARLDRLRLRYAAEDGRPPLEDWVEGALTPSRARHGGSGPGPVP